MVDKLTLGTEFYQGGSKLTWLSNGNTCLNNKHLASSIAVRFPELYKLVVPLGQVIWMQFDGYTPDAKPLKNLINRSRAKHDTPVNMCAKINWVSEFYKSEQSLNRGCKIVHAKRPHKHTHSEPTQTHDNGVTVHPIRSIPTKFNCQTLKQQAKFDLTNNE